MVNDKGSKAGQWADLQQLSGDLAQHRAAGNARAFFEALRPLAAWMRRHAIEELRSLDAEGAITPEQITPADVIDGVLLRAWDRFDKRPPRMPLDAWLIQLKHEVLEDYTRGQTAVSLDERVSALEPFQEEEAWWDRQTEDSLYPDTVPIEETLVGHGATDQWERLDLDTKQTHLAGLLDMLPGEQRRVLILHCYEGYEVPLIADIQNRSAEDVQADLTAAIDTLRHELQMRGYVEDAADLERQQRFERHGSRRKRS